jgi:hypothetical protein
VTPRGYRDPTVPILSLRITDPVTSHCITLTLLGSTVKLQEPFRRQETGDSHRTSTHHWRAKTKRRGARVFTPCSPASSHLARSRLHNLLARVSSGKNSRNFHTLGYEMGNLQKLVFLHTQKVLFHTLNNNFIPYNFFSYLQSLFHTLKTFFIPLYINFIPLKFVSYLENFFHAFMQQFHIL